MPFPYLHRQYSQVAHQPAKAATGTYTIPGAGSAPCPKAHQNPMIPREAPSACTSMSMTGDCNG